MNKIYNVNLQMFAGSENMTTTQVLTDAMKTYYSDYLIDTAEPNLVHLQFARKESIPTNGGKTIEYRKYDDLPKVLTALEEGVTPDAQKMSMGVITAEVEQYGGYVELTDQLIMTAIDKNIVIATKKIAKQAGLKIDTVVRDIINAGTNVQYGDGSVESRSAVTSDMKLTLDVVRRGVRSMKKHNVDPWDENYVAIIHPDVSYDLKSDPKWVDVKTYSDPEGIYTGEIGKIENVRFVETSQAAIFVSSGSGGIDVYSTLLIGDEAYGAIDVSGGGLEIIVKQLGSGGSSDPLDQRATVGWKAFQTAVILNEDAILRIETASTFNDHEAN